MILPACGWFYWPVINRKFCAISGASAWRLIYEVCKRQQDGQKILWSLIICKGQHGGQKGRRLSYVKLQLSIVHQQQSVLIHLKIGSEHFGILLQFETLRKWSVSIINANSQNWLVKIKKKHKSCPLHHTLKVIRHFLWISKRHPDPVYIFIYWKK